MIKYATDFWENYSENKKYFRMTFNYGNEPTGNVLTYLDEPLFNMLSDFYNKGKLKNTAVFIVSEQGNKNNGLYNILGSGEFELEKKYGLFIMILDWNDNFKNGKYHKNLLDNQNIYTTPYDIYESMIHIVLGNTSYYSNMQAMPNIHRKSMFNPNHNKIYCGK
jgi:membrane-anchored protein YejM (alkaline phosphatase superfamily)